MDELKTFQALEQKAEKQISSETEKGILDLDEFLSIQYPEEHYLVEHLIPKDGITIISSVPGMMKSMIVNYIAIKVAKGEKVFNLFPTSKTNVLIVDMENHFSLLSERLNAMNNGATKVPVYIYDREKHPKFNINDEENLQSLIRVIKKYHIGLVIFDSFRRIHTLDENTSRDMNIVFSAIKQIQALDCTILILHHEGKTYEGGEKSTSNYKDRMRGSSDILSEVDSQITIVLKRELEETIITFTQNKNRWNKPTDAFKVKYFEENNSIDYSYISKASQDFEYKQKLLDKIEEAQKGISRKELLEYGQNELQLGQTRIDNFLIELFKDRKVNFSKKSHGEKFYFPAIPSTNLLIEEEIETES